jgi:phosphotransferase system enzyme I (PtsP)
MAKRPGDIPRGVASEPALRVIMRRLRDIMGEAGDGQARLNQIVHLIAGVMVAEVCSIYLKRQDGSLELFATEGLNPSAIHATHMRRGEGLVGRCAELAATVNEPDAQSHPAFSYRPETGEDIYHSFLAVPVLRGGDVLGVLTIQNRTHRVYSDEDVEVLQATAMVLAEHLVSGAVAGTNTAAEFSRAVGHLVTGQGLAEGIALGHAYLHEPRVIVTDLLSEDPEAEESRLTAAIEEVRTALDEMLDKGAIASGGEHREVLEAYRMLANDRGWLRRLKEKVAAGMSAEAAVERVQNETRARMLRQPDAYWRERVRDLDDLSDRLLRVLTARRKGVKPEKDLPADTILIARTMGAAELLDYDRSRLKGLVLEEGSPQSHVSIVARALGIAAVGQVRGIVERVDPGNPMIVDAETAEVYVRPSNEVVSAYSEKARFRARRQQQYQSLREVPATTRDGVRIELMMNAGLQVDMPSLTLSGAEGIGLFRTELQFMVSATFPRLERQTQLYKAIVEEAGDKPIVFRTLDLGADKVLPYMRHTPEENPALGWRAVRMSLDRPALFRIQVRALLRATAGRTLRLMVPMITSVAEVEAAHSLVARELDFVRRHGSQAPKKILFGIMAEVPAVLFDLDTILRKVDFVSVGSNDLLQYLFAADRANDRVSGRYDALSVPALRTLALVAEKCRVHRVPLSLCGELAGRPLEAMALIGIGYRNLSMAPASIGPVKAMILSLEAGKLEAAVKGAMSSHPESLRPSLQAFAKAHGVAL